MEITRVPEVGIWQQASPDFEVLCAKWNWYQLIGSQGVSCQSFAERDVVLNGYGLFCHAVILRVPRKKPVEGRRKNG